MLHEFVAVNREKITHRCRAKVATRSHGHDLLLQGFTVSLPGLGCVLTVDLPRLLIHAAARSH